MSQNIIKKDPPTISPASIEKHVMAQESNIVNAAKELPKDPVGEPNTKHPSVLNLRLILLEILYEYFLLLW